MTDCKLKLNDLNPNIDPRLQETQLPNVLALPKGLRGDPLSNPEIYLLEFLNASQYFRQLSNGDEYKKPDTENNGENDAISKSYQVDFKLLISSSMGNGKRNTSLQKIVYTPGVVATVAPTGKRKYYDVSCLPKLLWDYSSEDLENRKYIKESEEGIRDLDNFTKILRTDKNILLFMPSTFSYTDNDLSQKEKVQILTDAMQYSLQHAFLYRRKHVVDKDTFFSTILEDDFVIWKYENDGLVRKDIVPLKNSNTFMYLAQFA